MPDKPTWFGRLDAILEELRTLPYPWVDRPTLERLLGVRRRRAQQILQNCGTHRVGANLVADRERLIAHLRRLADGQTAYYEKQRRERFVGTLEKWRQEWIANPKVPVEAPPSIVSQQFDDLPAGVDLRPGQITVRFETPREALEKLLALAMAIGNDFDRFERLASR